MFQFRSVVGMHVKQKNFNINNLYWIPLTTQITRSNRTDASTHIIDNISENDMAVEDIMHEIQGHIYTLELLMRKLT